MPKLHAKFHKNWWSRFQDIWRQDTQGHSFIIIRINGCITETEHFFTYVAEAKMCLIDFKWNTLYLHLPIWFASFYRTLSPAPGHI